MKLLFAAFTIILFILASPCFAKPVNPDAENITVRSNINRHNTEITKSSDYPVGKNSYGVLPVPNTTKKPATEKKHICVGVGCNCGGSE